MKKDPSVIAIVLAGGGGVRLWPYSRAEFPKQFLSFDGDLSLLQKTLVRISHGSFIKQIVISTQRGHLASVKQQLQSLSFSIPVTVYVEPERKNTGPSLVFALKSLEQQGALDEGTSLLVLPSDHWMEPESLFLHSIEEALPTAASGKIITFGIRPTRPETGYGYIVMGKRLDALTYQALQFIEKPPFEEAMKLFLRADAYWNAGIFLFQPKTFWDEMKKWAPDLAVYENKTLDNLKEEYAGLSSISIDYALMEKTSHLALCPLAVTWSDIGSWDSVYEALEKDAGQNVIRGDVHTFSTQNSLILSSERTVVTLGVADLLIIETAGHVLVAKRGESQKVRQAVEKLF